MTEFDKYLLSSHRSVLKEINTKIKRHLGSTVSFEIVKNDEDFELIRNFSQIVGTVKTTITLFTGSLQNMQPRIVGLKTAVDVLIV